MSSHPNPLLHGILAKFDRADESIQNLNTEINTYLRDTPNLYETHRDFEKDGRDYVFRVRGNPNVPLRFPVIAGEIIHHLRSALDHLVVALAVSANQKVLNTHQFPICRSADKFQKAVTSGCIKGISASARDRIEKAQPYFQAKPDDYILTVLHELDIRDKHRVLLFAVAAASMGDTLTVTANEPNITITNLSPPHRVKISEEYQEFFRVTLAEPKPGFEAEMGVSLQIAFEVCGLAKVVPVTNVLTGMRDWVAQLVNEFSGEF